MAYEEPPLRSFQVFKREVGLGLHGKDIKVKLQKTLDREKRVAWRDVQKRQAEAEKKKRADEIQMAQVDVNTDRDKAKIQARSQPSLRWGSAEGV